MNNFKVGDNLDINTNPADKALIKSKEGEFPRRVTSIKGMFVRFNGSSSGWYMSDFVKVPYVESIGDDPDTKADVPNTYNKYNREVIGFDGTKTTIDVYRVLDAFKVSDPALQHLIKKALCVGIRGHKDSITDYTDILKSAEKALELHKQKQEA